MTPHSHTSSTALASPPDDTNLLWEILLRLPPQPSSIPRASLVCKQWRRLATDPHFLRRFCAHHRNPPLLGFFTGLHGVALFSSILDPPDSIPPERFSLRVGDEDDTWTLLGCRHGRVLIINRTRREVIVCGPITGDQRRLAIPPEFVDEEVSFTGAVLCAAGDPDHVHGSCHSSPFKVVLVRTSYRALERQSLALVYSSEIGMWENLISTEIPYPISCGSDSGSPATLVGNALYWFLTGNEDVILEYDLHRQSLDVIEMHPDTNESPDGCVQIIRTEDGGVGLAILLYPTLQIWERKVNCHGVAGWMLQKTIDLHKVLGLGSRIERWRPCIQGYAEDVDVIFLWLEASVFMVQLESMQFKKLPKPLSTYYPFTSFYTAGLMESEPEGSINLQLQLLDVQSDTNLVEWSY